MMLIWQNLLTNRLHFALHVRPQNAVLVGCAAEVMGSESWTLPRGQVGGVEAGGGAAPAEIGQRRGGQKNHKREGKGAEREYAGHDLLYHAYSPGIISGMDSVTILGLRVDRVSVGETLAAIDRFIQEKTPHTIVTADASMAVIARQDPELHAIVEGADLVTPDGAGILLASRLLGVPVSYKVSGVDLVAHLCALSPGKGYRIFFLGAAPGVAAEAAEKAQVRWPGTHIVGVRDGYFTPEQEPTVLAQIKAAAPDIVMVAFGIPKQEKWIARHKAALGVPVFMGIGGSFDVLSGRVKRAPVFMQRFGFEWLYRLIQNPKKISKVMTLPQFALLVLRQRFLGAT